MVLVFQPGFQVWRCFDQVLCFAVRSRSFHGLRVTLRSLIVQVLLVVAVHGHDQVGYCQITPAR